MRPPAHIYLPCSLKRKLIAYRGATPSSVVPYGLVLFLGKRRDETSFTVPEYSRRAGLLESACACFPSPSTAASRLGAKRRPGLAQPVLGG